jgi:hypothetical protein
MTNVHRLRRLVEVAPPLSPSSPAARVIPIARYLRPAGKRPAIPILS